MLSIYFILLSAGLFLYFIEVAGPMSAGGKAIAYGLTAVWILFNWFYIRPRTIKKQQRAIDAIITKLRHMDEQLTSAADDVV